MRPFSWLDLGIMTLYGLDFFIYLTYWFSSKIRLSKYLHRINTLSGRVD